VSEGLVPFIAVRTSYNTVYRAVTQSVHLSMCGLVRHSINAKLMHMYGLPSGCLSDNCFWANSCWCVTSVCGVV
jgi:hypothetical protein